MAAYDNNFRQFFHEGYESFSGTVAQFRAWLDQFDDDQVVDIDCSPSQDSDCDCMVVTVGQDYYHEIW